MGNSKNNSLLLTKITPPRGNNLVSRQRLFQRLDDLSDIPLVWMVGPPGSGKTSLASSYLSQHTGGYLWYQLDEGDANIGTFFHYFRSSIQQASPLYRQKLPALSPEYLPGLKIFVRRYAEVIGAHLKKPSVIVLDNYDELPIQAPLHAVVHELVSCLLPGVRLLVLSRTEPPPAFARLRMHGNLVILDGVELNLTLDEAHEIAATKASQTGKGLIPDQIKSIYVETQGWIAGFTLLLAGTRDTSSGLLRQTGTQQVLFDYFAAEIFERFPLSIQHGLVCAALLPMMTIANLERLTGNGETAAILDSLQQQNCFVVQRVQAETVYEYHALFRAFLLSRALTIITEEEWRNLQQKAAHLLAHSQQADAAADLFRTGKNWLGLAELVLREGSALISAGRHQTLEQWLRYLPADLFEKHPWLCYWLGMARLPFDPEEARGHFEQAYTGFQAQEDTEGLYSTWAGIMDSFFYEWEDLRPADRWIAEFESLRARHPAFPSRAVEMRTYWAMGTLLHRQPQHPFVPVWAERAEAILNVSDRELSVLLGGYLVIHHLWRGDSSKAHELIQRLAPWTQSTAFSPMVAILWSCAVGLYHSVRGDLERCLPIVEAGLSLACKTGLTCWDFLLSAQAARCSLVAGNLTNADTWIARMATTVRHHSHINGGFIEHLRSNAAGQRGEWFRALDHARKGLAMAQESGVPFLEAHCRIDLARALIGQDDLAEWPEHLQIAHAIGQGMHSKVLQYLCLEVKAEAAFERGEQAVGQGWLEQALALSKEMVEPIWQMAGPRANSQLYERALALGINTDHVRQLVRRRRLEPSQPATAPDDWPWPVRIYTLGRFEILCDNEPLRSSRKAQHKPLELIKILCAFGGHAIHQDRITEALWPDAEGDAAEQALGTTLHRLRKLLQHEGAVRLEDRQLSLDFRYVWVDALAFDRIAHHPNRVDRFFLQCALNRYRGHFLEGDSASWALAFRERLRSHFLKMSERLGAFLEQEGDWSAAIDCYHRVIEIEPVAESFYRRLMTCHAQLGQRAEALSVFQRCRQTLLTYLGVSPTKETQTLYQRLIES